MLLNQQPPLIPAEEHHMEDHFDDDMHAWAVSYADMLMVLLSFFVIFFSVSQDERKQVIQMITKDFVQGKGPREGTGEGKGEGVAEPGAAPVPATTLQKVLSDFQTQVVEDSDQLIINFEDNLYQSGQVRLPPNASEQLVHLVEKLEPFMDRIELTFIGHSDSAPIASNRKQFLLKNNFDLSVLRASNAVDFAIQAGIPADHLSAKGYAATRRNSRTLSIVIEPFEPRTGVIIPEKSGPIQPSPTFENQAPTSLPTTGSFNSRSYPTTTPSSGTSAPTTAVPGTGGRRFDLRAPATPPPARTGTTPGTTNNSTPGSARPYERSPSSLPQNPVPGRPSIPGSRSYPGRSSPGLPQRRENIKMPDEKNPDENWRYIQPPHQYFDSEIGETARLDDPRLLAPSLGIPSMKGQYSIQIGAFGSEKNAAHFTESFPELANQVYYVPERKGEDLLYKVYVGLFGSEKDASSASQGLSQLKIKGQLVRPVRVTSEVYESHAK